MPPIAQSHQAIQKRSRSLLVGEIRAQTAAITLNMVSRLVVSIWVEAVIAKFIWSLRLSREITCFVKRGHHIAVGKHSAPTTVDHRRQSLVLVAPQVITRLEEHFLAQEGRACPLLRRCRQNYYISVT